MNTPSYLIFGLGYLGRPLAQRLYRQGFAVRGVKRTLTSDDINLPIPVDTCHLDDSGCLKDWNAYQTWIFLLPPSQLADYTAVHARLIAAAEDAGVAHLIFTGSVSVYGSASRVCDETSPRQPESESARRIAAVEQLLLNSRIEHTDILHLGGLYCAERHPIFSLLKRTGISGRRSPVNMIHRDRAVEAIFQAACQPNGKRIGNIVETPHLDKETFYRREAAKLGCPQPDFDLSDTSAEGKTVVSLRTG